MTILILCLRYLHLYFMASSLAFSSLNSALDNLAGTIRSSTENVLAIAQFILKSLQQWGVELISNMLFSCMVFLNPRLSPAQQSHLLSITSRAIEKLVLQGFLDEHLIRSIIALTSPDQGTCLLLNYLVEVFSGISAAIEESTYGDIEEEQETERLMIKQYGIQSHRVAGMSPGVRKAILKALGNGESGDGDTSPVCCITLEPLLWPDCTLTVDVVAVVVKGHRMGRDHAFLYRGCALNEWLSRRQVPLSPETRSVVKPSDVYRLS